MELFLQTRAVLRILHTQVVFSLDGCLSIRGSLRFCSTKACPRLHHSVSVILTLLNCVFLNQCSFVGFALESGRVRGLHKVSTVSAWLLSTERDVLSVWRFLFWRHKKTPFVTLRTSGCRVPNLMIRDIFRNTTGWCVSQRR